MLTCLRRPMTVYQNPHFLRDLVDPSDESSALPDVSFLQSKEGQRISALGKMTNSAYVGRTASQITQLSCPQAFNRELFTLHKGRSASTRGRINIGCQTSPNEFPYLGGITPPTTDSHLAGIGRYWNRPILFKRPGPPLEWTRDAWEQI